MGKVDREEMGQWIQEMKSLAREYERISSGITESWKKGLDDFREVWADGELPTLVEKIRKMPIPKELVWKWYKENFEAAIRAQIKAHTIVAKYAGRAVPGSNWAAESFYWIGVSKVFLDNMFSDLGSWRKKYQL